MNELHAHLKTRQIYYWRDKRGHEIDLVLSMRKKPPIAIDCKWSASDFDPTNVKAFRGQYSRGKTFIVATDVDRAYRRSFGDIEVTFVHLGGLITSLAEEK